jgi:hypothetical protein
MKYIDELFLLTHDIKFQFLFFSHIFVHLVRSVVVQPMMIHRQSKSENNIIIKHVYIVIHVKNR